MAQERGRAGLRLLELAPGIGRESARNGLGWRGPAVPLTLLASRHPCAESDMRSSPAQIYFAALKLAANCLLHFIESK